MYESIPMNLESKIKSIISDIAYATDRDIELDASLSEDLCMDSLDVSEIVMELEAILDKPTSDEEASSWKTVQDVVDAAERMIE